jgi:LuxR family maltose regulon positive regulatory protein
MLEAARWVEGRGLKEEDEPSYPREREYLMLARVLLTRHEPYRALGLLEHLGALAQAQGRTESVIEARLLQALAFHAVGDGARAMTALAEALASAEPEGYVRIFVDEGAPMRFLIADLRLHPQKFWGLQIAESSDNFAQRLLPYVDQLIAAFSRADDALPKQSEIQNLKSKILVEPLSEREREILRLLAEGLSNREIAQKLYLAVGTVKVHLKHIYGKLGANSRTQAVARARERNVL